MIEAKTLDDIEISRGKIEDAAALATFAAHTFEATYAAHNKPEDMQDHLSSNFGVEQQTAELVDPNTATILVRSGGALVAYAQVRKHPPPDCVPDSTAIELHRFYLDRKAHGTGLALALMQEVREAARDLGGRHVWLGVWEQNPRAIAFYKKAKFIDVGGQIFMVGPDEQQDRVLVACVDQKEKSQ